MNPQTIKRPKTSSEKIRGRWQYKRKKLRPILLKESNYICANPYCCIRDESGNNLHIDHIIPVSRGGTNDIENLQVLCAPCNRDKGTMTMGEWQKRIENSFALVPEKEIIEPKEKFSVTISSALIQRLSPFELALYINYLQTCKLNDGETVKSYETLATETGISVAEIKRCRRSLIEKGYIKITYSDYGMIAHVSIANRGLSWK